MSLVVGKSCCRLCLAPDNECVSIFKTQAADKLPIQEKIAACVQIQVSGRSVGTWTVVTTIQLCFSDSPQKSRARGVRGENR